MKCPYCQIGVRIELSRHAYPVKRRVNLPDVQVSDGVEVSSGLCPECGELLVFLREGRYVVHEDAGEIDSSMSEQRIYPHASRRILDESIPSHYQRDFQEAALLIEISPRSSAALSRRLLQGLIRNEYGIRKTRLVEEIKEFRQLEMISLTVRDAVDVIRQVGNLAAHPEWTSVGEVVDVEPDEASWLLDVLELVFEDKFVGPSIEAKRRKNLDEKLRRLGKQPIA